MKSRDYLAGTKEALVAFSRGVCYFPECERPVIEFRSGHPLMAVEVAHIFAAEPGGPHYDAGMSDDQRRHFDNLILLCKPHHTLVDKRAPASYPPSVRQSWKAQHELRLQGQERSALGRVSSADVERLIEEALAGVAPQTIVKVSLSACARFGDGFLTFPIEGFGEFLRSNIGKYVEGTSAITARAHNVGHLPVDIEGWSLLLDLHLYPAAPVRFVGANDYPYEQRVPQRLEIGASNSWRWSVDAVTAAIGTAKQSTGRPVVGLRAEADLGTGDTVDSEPVGVAGLPI